MPEQRHSLAVTQLKRPPQLDHRTLKLIVGVIALLLASITSSLTGNTITSISAAYWAGPPASTVLVGCLFAIAAFMAAYNGFSLAEMICSKLAAVAALCIALFPCNCDRQHPEVIPYVHYGSAAIMFGILAFFCYGFAHRARRKPYPQGKLRAVIYAVCGIAILIAIAALVVDNFTGWFTAKFNRFTFLGEEVALSSFGISWLTASHIVPVVTNRAELYWKHSMAARSVS